MSVERPKPTRRADYAVELPIRMRWMDNDIYGHVNNVQYYSFVDTAVNDFLIGEGGLDIHTGPTIGITVESGCRFHAPLTYPGVIDAALRVASIGTSSVRYEVGLFAEGSDESSADAFFVHVFVDRASRRPAPIPDPLRTALSRLA